jgi:Fuc2NAc and GlcNAc transferase
VGGVSPILYFAALVMGATGAWLVSRHGISLGLVDTPNQRSSHRTPIPKGGGVGILAAFVTVSVAAQVPKSFWIPATFIALVSLFADRLDFSPKVRLILQFAVATIFVAEIRCDSLAHWAGALLSFVSITFVVGTANCYNFMDGINGIASIAGLMAFGLLALVGLDSGLHPSLVNMAAGVAIACLGFLPFNMPTARVFLGDVGSILLGFVFAGAVTAVATNAAEFICLASFLFPFYADEICTMAVRIREGESLFKPHRRHIYQLLANEKGIAHWKISIGYGVVQLSVGLGAFFIKPFGLVPLIGVLLACFLGFSVFGQIVRRSVFHSNTDSQNEAVK